MDTKQYMDCNGTVFWSEYHEDDVSRYYDYPTYRPVRKSPILKSMAHYILDLEEWDVIHNREDVYVSENI